MCINIRTCQGCSVLLRAETDSCTESNNLLNFCFFIFLVVFLAPSPPPDVKSPHLGLTPVYTTATQGCWLSVLRLFQEVSSARSPTLTSE